jgi:hypothetical protein
MALFSGGEAAMPTRRHAAFGGGETGGGKHLDAARGLQAAFWATLATRKGSGMAAAANAANRRFLRLAANCKNAAARCHSSRDEMKQPGERR